MYACIYVCMYVCTGTPDKHLVLILNIDKDRSAIEPPGQLYIDKRLVFAAAARVCLFDCVGKVKGNVVA